MRFGDQTFLGVAGADPSHAVADGLHILPVSVTMQCVMFLLVQYFTIYTLLAVVRTYNTISGNGKSKAESVLVSSTSTVALAPMMAVLFLASRMRAVQLSGGKNGDPHHVGIVGMLSASWALLATTVVALLVPCFSKTSEVEGESAEAGNKWVGYVMVSAKYTLLVSVYGGVVAVVYAIFTTEHDPKVFQNGPPAVAPAVASTMYLTSIYFVVYTMLAVVSNTNEIRGQKAGTWEETLKLATATVHFCPMLAILFIGARMRALQIDPVNGAPQRWAQLCFFACAYAVLAQAICVVVTPLFGIKSVAGDLEGDVTFTFEADNTVAKFGYYACTAVRYLGLAALYGCSTAVIVSVWTIEAKSGPTPAVSPAMQCVMMLTCQFFFIYLMLFLSVTWRDVMGSGGMIQSVQTTMEVAKTTVVFAPALAVLFVGVRMRALQVTDNKCGPPVFAQNCMFLATYQLAIQLCMILVFPYVARVEKAETDEEGNVKAAACKNPTVGTASEVLRYSSTLIMYVGIVAACYALFTVSQGTANCGGAETTKFLFLSVQGPSTWVVVLSGVLGLVPVGLLGARACNAI